MFFELLGELMKLFDEAWLLLSHVANRSSFPRVLRPDEERAIALRMKAGDEAVRILEDIIPIEQPYFSDYF